MAKRGKPDFYAEKAKKEGYPARSVYKLKEIQERFHVIKRSAKVLDIGAAPGSWSLYASQCVGRKGSVCGVDLLPIELKSPPDNVTFLCGDAFLDEIREEIVESGTFDTVLSDAAPKTTGNRVVDTGRSSELVGQVVDLALKVLKPGGSLVIKVFQGGDEQELMQNLKQHFSAVRYLKPKASRNESFETFAVATSRRSR